LAPSDMTTIVLLTQLGHRRHPKTPFGMVR
jgi:hypothetical protein